MIGVRHASEPREFAERSRVFEFIMPRGRARSSRDSVPRGLCARTAEARTGPKAFEWKDRKDFAPGCCISTTFLRSERKLPAPPNHTEHTVTDYITSTRTTHKNRKTRNRLPYKPTSTSIQCCHKTVVTPVSRRGMCPPDMINCRKAARSSFTSSSRMITGRLCCAGCV